VVEVRFDDGAGVVEVTASGKLTRADYESFVDAFDAFVRCHGRVSVLFVMRDFHGWDLSGAWEDTKLWAHHLGGFRRIALVGEAGWQRAMAGLCRLFTTAPVRFFGMDEVEAARAWVRGPAEGAVHVALDEERALARVRIEGELTPEDFERVGAQIDPFIERHGTIRILLDVRGFHGWDSIEALVDHLRFIGRHQRHAGRIAVVGSHAWQRLLATTLGHLLHPEVRYFGGDEAAAEAWVAEGG